MNEKRVYRVAKIKGQTRYKVLRKKERDEKMRLKQVSIVDFLSIDQKIG